MGGSPGNINNPIYPQDSFGIKFGVDNKPFEKAIDIANQTGILGMLGVPQMPQTMMGLASKDLTDEERKKILMDQFLGR